MKASHWVVASRFAALAAVLETPGSRTAVCRDASAQVSRAELSPEQVTAIVATSGATRANVKRTVALRRSDAVDSESLRNLQN